MDIKVHEKAVENCITNSHILRIKILKSRTLNPKINSNVRRKLEITTTFQIVPEYYHYW